MKAVRLVTWFLLAAAPAPAFAQESYYVVVFGAQRPILNQPDHTHSWAMFVRVAPDPRRPGAYFAESHTVSWMPANLQVRSLALLPEPGVNLDLPRSLQWAQDDCLRVSMWGPYQINACLFERALAKKAHLESGQVRYKAADIGQDVARVCNCVHALSDISEGKRLRVAQSAWGDAASYFVTLTFRRYMIHPESTHDWLLGPLGLCDPRFVRRDLENNPTRNPLLRGLQNLHHADLRRN